MKAFGETVAAVDHGGSLGRARALFPHAPEPFVDLSTGINPHSYPLFDLPTSALARLPEAARLQDLKAAAVLAYGVPSVDHVMAAPGTQSLLPQIASLMPPGRAMVLGPTYAEHARAAALAGHTVTEIGDFEALAEADLAIVVNPNNPDGRVVSREHLLALAGRLAAKGGILVVDEAFMDVGPRAESLAGAVGHAGLVVLRSFGKFFGLAGLRLGFALAPAAITARLEALFGPWAVAGPALEYGVRALADVEWQAHMRATLASEAERLDALFSRFGIVVAGGCPLFRYLDLPNAGDLFRALGERGILLRHFADRPRALRAGLPGSAVEWQRLETALSERAAALPANAEETVR
ncbi:threonine-phosphate decarboxylase CobD [Manganibacter manganicus]|uniref:threonine-phosphate decarboxylase n=1 Tax=Manganibacter manganicus TaxID=1873176 RepID=A0A1V8RW64_9HYPH|nr:threonine-phosphate decarboxylase CobD [Pseudaminobacter manganicus]OQM77450.1 threonine-phosphate decarboxylase [Pseudaminobacter manganicus]